jgi:hypothetical protein
MDAGTRYASAEVSVRAKISALWTAMLFVFAYVDIFGFFRADVRAEIEAGEVGGFTVNGLFLLATTIYVAIPSLMIFATLVLRPRVARIANIALAVVLALTIAVGAVGEWGYYVFGSALEIAMLLGIVYLARTWPTEVTTTTTGRPDAPIAGVGVGHDGAP